MSFFLKGLPVSAITINAAPHASIGNLLDPQPKLVYASASPAVAWGPIYVNVDLGADTSFDTACLLFHNGSSTLRWRLYVKTAAEGAFAPGEAFGAGTNLFPFTPARPVEPTVTTDRFHALWAGAPATARYLRFQIDSPDGTSPNFMAGCLMIGTRLQPGADIALPGVDWGFGRRISDLSEVQVLDGGERAIWGRAKVPIVRGSFSHLTDAELRKWWAILTDIGLSGPLLFVEDSSATAGQQERIHYGTLTSIEPYERRQADKSRIEFQLTHWL